MSGVITKSIIPMVGSKVDLSCLRSVGITIVRCLLGHAGVAENMYKMRLAASPNCTSCGAAREDVEHLLLHCESFKEERGRLTASLPGIRDLGVADALGVVPSSLTGATRKNWVAAAHEFISNFKL